MAVNLSRNTRVLFTTKTGATQLADFTSANTWEIQVLDGYSFTQNTEQQVIQLSEAGTNPIRGERAFNSQLNPVDWSMSTYIRPYKSTNVMAPEKYLWNAMMGARVYTSAPLTATAASTMAVTGSTATGYFGTITTSASVSSDNSVADAVCVGDAIKITGVSGLTIPGGGSGIFRVTARSATNTITVSLETYTAPGTATGLPVWYKGQWYETPTKAETSVQGTNVNKLQAFGLVFLVDSSVYYVDNAAVNQAELSFDINGIAQIAWSGFGTTLKDITTFGTFVASTHYTTLPSALSSSNFITNRLSTTTLISKLGGNDGSAGTTYVVPITGGNLTINNNIEYLTPEVLGAVNTPIGYFTGSRSITGSLTAYLKTGTNESAKLLKDILDGLVSTSETKFKLQIEVGGATGDPRVELLMNYCQLQVPSVDVQDVISTTINFTAQGAKGTTSTTAYDQSYDIEATNNLLVSYIKA